jgi:tetratricopeptide (TPR) repeat protein
MNERFAKAHLDEIEEYRGGEKAGFRAVRKHFGIQAFGINAWSAAGPGAYVIEPHRETNPFTLRHEELYFVARGHAVFELDGEEVDAPVGTFVFVRDPDVERAAVAREPDTLVLALGGEPGKPYEVGPWEWSYPAYLALVRGDPADAKRLLEEALDRYPDHPRMLYRLAWAKLGLGEHEEARVTMARAIELEPELRERARGDPDVAEIAP